MAALRLNLDEFVGKMTGPPRIAADPVNAPMIRHWCQAIGDTNPIYSDDAAARACGFDGLVAPPTLLASWTHHDRRFPPPPASAEYPESQLIERLEVNGYRSVVATNLEQEYVRYLNCGDRITLRGVIESISALKHTALGDGYFITFRYEYRDDLERTVGSMMQRILRFIPAPRASSPVRSDVVETEVQAPSLEAVQSPAPYFAQLGDEIGEVELPITATLIVTGAIASRDFHVLHHDHGKAQALGSRDIIMNIYVTAGVFGRYVTDWAGQCSRLLRLSVRLGVPNYPGDVMRITGRVTDVESNAGNRVLTLAVRGTNSAGEHASGSIVLVAQSPD